MILPEITLLPLQPDDREQFILDDQWAFKYGAQQEFGMRDERCEEALAEINAKYKVDAVVTHTALSFCELITKDGLMGWATWDATLLKDCERERATLDRIFDSLLEAGHPITHWYYGHFHQSWNSTINGVRFSMLDIMEFKELR